MSITISGEIEEIKKFITEKEINENEKEKLNNIRHIIDSNRSRIRTIDSKGKESIYDFKQIGEEVTRLILGDDMYKKSFMDIFDL